MVGGVSSWVKACVWGSLWRLVVVQSWFACWLRQVGHEKWKEFQAWVLGKEATKMVSLAGFILGWVKAWLRVQWVYGGFGANQSESQRGEVSAFGVKGSGRATALRTVHDSLQAARGGCNPFGGACPDKPTADLAKRTCSDSLLRKLGQWGGVPKSTAETALRELAHRTCSQSLLTELA